MLTYDPDIRISAREALKHPFFKVLHDAEISSKEYVLSSMSPKVLKKVVDNTPKNLYCVKVVTCGTIAMTQP